MSRIAIVVKGYPRLSETFIAQEILELERRGFQLLIVSLRHPTDSHVHDINEEIAADVLYLPEYLQDDPKRVAIGDKWAKSQQTFQAARNMLSADLQRDRTANRWRRWGQACVLARELPDDIAWIHTHYLHTPCSVARYAAALRGLNWSFSAHAKDIWTTKKWELKEKINASSWGVTCTQLNVDYLKSLAKCPEKISLVYHGLDFSRFPAAPNRISKTDDSILLLSVGRAVEKKGYEDLLTALYRVRKDRRWRFEHIGGGNHAEKLKEKADQLGIADRIVWHGAKDRSFVIDSLARADVFVLPCRIAKSGDRDGLPNVLMEAQVMGLPVISSDVSAIPEIITDGKNGLLTPQKQPKLLANAISRLMNDTDLRLKLGKNGAKSVKRKFNCHPGIDYLAEKFRSCLSTGKSDS